MKRLMILGTFHMESQNDIHNLKDTNRITSMQDELSIIVENYLNISQPRYL